jgi:hypothetical protein
MKLVPDSGKIANAYSVETNCPFCNVSKLRVDIEFEVVTFENGQAIGSSYTIKNLCAHCLTVCNESSRKDFLCARCEHLTSDIEEDEPSDSERSLFQHLFSKDDKFGVFYQKLTKCVLGEVRRYCFRCVYEIWQEYLRNPDSLQEELEKPKKEYPLKTTGKQY